MAIEQATKDLEKAERLGKPTKQLEDDLTNLRQKRIVDSVQELYASASKANHFPPPLITLTPAINNKVFESSTKATLFKDDFRNKGLSDRVDIYEILDLKFPEHYEARKKEKFKHKAMAVTGRLIELKTTIEELDKSNKIKEIENKLHRRLLGSNSMEEMLTHSIGDIISTDLVRPKTSGAILLANEETKTLKLTAHDGFTDKAFTKRLKDDCSSVAYGDCLCGKAANDGFAFEDRGVKHHHFKYENMTDHGHYCFSIKPREKDGVLGVLNLFLNEDQGQNKREKEYVISILPTIADVIERKNMEDELRIAKKNAENESIEKNFYVTTMAHDIKNKIHGILLGSDIALDFIKGMSESRANQVEELYSDSIEVVHRLEALVHSVMDYNSIINNCEQIQINFIDAHRLGEELKKDFTGRAEVKGVVIKNEFEKGTCLCGHEALISLLFANLMSNAVNHSKLNCGGVIRIYKSIEEPGTVVIEDTGTGMSKKQLDNLFSWARADDNLEPSRHPGTLNEEGTGFGLKCVEKILVAHNGKIKVKSEKGKGSIFKVNLPVVTPNLMIIDEDKVSCSKFKEFLSQLGTHNCKANAKKEALSILLDSTKDLPHLLFIDKKIAFKNNFEFIKIIKRTHRTRGLRTIVIVDAYNVETLKKMQIMEKENLIHNHEDFILKPFDIESLKEKAIAKLGELTFIEHVAEVQDN